MEQRLDGAPGMIRARTDYVNCPMNQEEYDAFWKELTTAQEAEVHGFEDRHGVRGLYAGGGHGPPGP